MGSKIKLIGRNIIKPKDLSSSDIISLLWTATELKTLSNQSNKEINYIKGANITFFLTEGNYATQTLVNAASRLMGTNLNVIVDSNWENERHIEDVGRYLSIDTDLILCHSKHHIPLEKLIQKSRVPVVNIKSCRYVIPQVLSSVMLINSHFGYFKDLTATWVGDTCNLLNTYLCIFPQLGINMHYLCSFKTETLVSPALLHVAQEYCKESKSKLVECKTIEEALDNTDILIISMCSNSYTKINLKSLCDRKKNCIILYMLPRGSKEVEDDLFEDKRCLVWNTVENVKWIYAAYMLRLLSDYEHTTQKPSIAKNN